MVNFLTNRTSPGKIGNVTLDATLSEQHVYRNEVTSYSVEDGSFIGDHVQVKPPSVTIQGIISNSPLWNSGSPVSSITESFRSSAIGSVMTNSGKRTEDALSSLLRIAGRVYPISDQVYVPRTGTISLVTIVTGLRVYSDMALVTLTINRDGTTGDSLQFTAEFMQVDKVTFSRVFIQPPVRETVRSKASSTAKVGKVSTTTPKPKVSILANMYNNLTSGGR